MKIVKLLLIIITTFLSGCGSITGGLKTETETMRASKNSNIQEIGMFATEANARVIIANVNAGRFCAEPPPETQTTESTSFRLMLNAALNSSDDEVKIEAFRTFSQGLRQLYKRSHSNQLYRDSSYYLCQAFINGALNNENLALFLDMLVMKEEDTKKKAEVSASAKSLMDKINKEDTSINSTYLAAQLLLSRWAFESLKEEVKEYYKAENKYNEGKVDAYLEGLEQLEASMKSVETSLHQVGSTTSNTLNKVEVNSTKLDSIKEDVGKLQK